MSKKKSSITYPMISDVPDICRQNPLDVFKEGETSKENEIKTLLINILGKDAISAGRMQISDETSKLAKAINYLVLQLNSLGRINERDERKSYIETIYSQLIEILKK